jgi:serine/threonine protein phosphatase PrpC
MPASPSSSPSSSPPGWDTDRSLSVSTAQDSAAGKRETNEDSMGLFVPDEPRMLTHKGVAVVISDGVSAAEAGREAAETCVKSFLGDYFSTPETWTVETSARKVLGALNGWLYRKSSEFIESQRGYVCTLSILVLKSRTAYFFHVGDTRIYLYRGGKLRQLTRDHTTRVSDRDTYLARAMGLDSRIDIDFGTEALQRGDQFLLTTDGIHGLLSDSIIAHTLGTETDARTIPKKLMDAALAAGGEDNVTCQWLRVDGLPDADADEYVNHLTALPFPPPALEPGWLLDGFKIEKELHASSRSQLYVVTDPKGQKLVMKTPSVNFSDDPAYIERFVLEQWVGARVESRHLIRSVTPPDNRTCLYNLMEYVDGRTLSGWAEGRPGKLPKSTDGVIAIVAQIVRGLIALHRRQILHQDIKPDNVMVGSDGVVKIVDYGSAWVAGVDELPKPIERERALGTVSYSAPEYALGIKPKTNADLYSLGCITYELLTGKHPYGAAAESAKTRADFDALRYVPASSVNPHVPVWADRAIQKAVHVDPDRRYQELTEFLYDLEHPNPEFTTPVRDSERPDPERGWQRFALLLLVALVASWAYFLAHG